MREWREGVGVLCFWKKLEGEKGGGKAGNNKTVVVLRF